METLESAMAKAEADIARINAIPAGVALDDPDATDEPEEEDPDEEDDE